MKRGDEQLRNMLWARDQVCLCSQINDDDDDDDQCSEAWTSIKLFYS